MTIWVYHVIIIFELKVTKSSAPEVPIFERFAGAWDSLDKTSYKSGLEDATVRSEISDDVCTEIKKKIYHQLSKSYCPFEYKEFLELDLIFLGGDINAEKKFHTPGPTSHARFMGKAIYDLKIFIFREKFQLSAPQLKGIREICIFIVRLYIKAWYGCMNAIAAPNQNYNFILDSIAYAQTDKVASDKILEKMKFHLWYLSDFLIQRFHLKSREKWQNASSPKSRL